MCIRDSVDILLLTVSSCELFERHSYTQSMTVSIKKSIEPARKLLSTVHRDSIKEENLLELTGIVWCHFSSLWAEKQETKITLTSWDDQWNSERCWYTWCWSQTQGDVSVDPVPRPDAQQYSVTLFTSLFTAMSHAEAVYTLVCMQHGLVYVPVSNEPRRRLILTKKI